MSDYIIQLEENITDKIELEILKEILHDVRYISKSMFTTTKELKNIDNLKDWIPIGNIPFITKWLRLTHNIDKENPIEIPEYLRTEEFLKRDYKIMKAKDLPRTGNYFIKDIDTLKHFSYAGNLAWLDIDGMLKPAENKLDSSIRLKQNTTMSVSEIYNIKSEYRVYVIDGEIENISNYNGYSYILPDIGLIEKAVKLINSNEKYLKSYTLDIMVGDRGTAIIEVHNFASVGLYSTLWGDNLLYAYKQGIEYLIKDNKKLSY